MDKRTIALVAVTIVVIVVVGAAVVLSFDDDSDIVTEGVNYHGNGGRLSDGNDVYGVTSHTVSDNRFINEGANFNCWNTKADGTGTRYNVGDHIDYASGKSTDLYAIWDSSSIFRMTSVINYFSLYYEGQKLVITNDFLLPSSGSMGISVQADETGGVFQIIDDHTIVYQIDDGTSIASYTLILNFTGTTQCKFDIIDGTPVVSIEFDGTTDVTMGGNASKSVHSKGITYNGNGGKTVDGKSRFMDDSHTAASASTFVCDGKTFKSWNTRSDGTGTSYNPGDNVPYSGYALLFAIWA